MRHSGQFRKDLKLAQRRGCDLDKLAAIIDLLQAGQPLPAANRDHRLKGTRERECHIEPDWLLIYRFEAGELLLVRTGTHSDLFG
jgi:mRNA interferase YafQ